MKDNTTTSEAVIKEVEAIARGQGLLDSFDWPARTRILNYWVRYFNDERHKAIEDINKTNEMLQVTKP